MVDIVQKEVASVKALSKGIFSVTQALCSEVEVELEETGTRPWKLALSVGLLPIDHLGVFFQRGWHKHSENPWTAVWRRWSGAGDVELNMLPAVLSCLILPVHCWVCLDSKAHCC